MLSALNAMQCLTDGNERFVSSSPGLDVIRSCTHESYSHSEQAPFAIILGCSDSRVPPEILFDQGIGDLFVIRVAGNIVTPEIIGSLEFAAAKFCTRLIVVLGHSMCGAVQESVRLMQTQGSPLTQPLAAVHECIRVSVAKESESADTTQIVHDTIRSNVENSVRQIQSESALLKDLIASDGLVVVGARYCLETGRVEFFEHAEGNETTNEKATL
jgi:carbonic anhydrase